MYNTVLWWFSWWYLYFCIHFGDPVISGFYKPQLFLKLTLPLDSFFFVFFPCFLLWHLSCETDPHESLCHRFSVRVFFLGWVSFTGHSFMHKSTYADKITPQQTFCFGCGFSGISMSSADVCCCHFAAVQLFCSLICLLMSVLPKKRYGRLWTLDFSLSPHDDGTCSLVVKSEIADLANKKISRNSAKRKKKEKWPYFRIPALLFC